MAERILNLYTTYAYTDAYWSATEKDRHGVRSRIASESTDLAETTHLYTVFPARPDTDILIWTAWDGDGLDAATKAFGKYEAVLENWRRFVRPVQTLWGYTRPSSYSRGKSDQDMDPFATERAPYLVVYPFSKTKEWYLMSMDARQGMMNEHIKIGKQFFDIKQLLIYSFGLQDQEFVVSYEMGDLARFSDLVRDLRSTEGRKYTSLDTPIIAATYRTPEAFIR